MLRMLLSCGSRGRKALESLNAALRMFLGCHMLSDSACSCRTFGKFAIPTRTPCSRQCDDINYTPNHSTGGAINCRAAESDESPPPPVIVLIWYRCAAGGSSTSAVRSGWLERMVASKTSDEYSGDTA